MVKFIPVQNQDYKYPSDSGITPEIQERKANFFKTAIKKTSIRYISLHTDPPVFWREPQRSEILSSEFLKDFPSILSNMHDTGRRCFSKLWCDDKEWSKDFSRFLLRLTDGIQPQWIKIIEIHPPFDRYCNCLESFVERYAVFEEITLKNFPSACMCIENRYTHSGRRPFGKFILSTNTDMIRLTELISKYHLKLKLAVDIPQLFSQHEENENKSISEEGMIEKILAPMKDIREFIVYTHIWGKTIDGVHNADLTTYFSKNQKLKDCFLQEICKLFDDGKARYFLPEVSSEDYIKSIVMDLMGVGIDCKTKIDEN